MLFEKSKSGEIVKTIEEMKNTAVLKSQGHSLPLQIVHHDSVKGLKNGSVN